MAKGALDCADPNVILGADLRRVSEHFRALGPVTVQMVGRLRAASAQSLQAQQAHVGTLFLVVSACALLLVGIAGWQLRWLGRERRRAEAANMNHELRTPLNGIIGTLDLLADDGLPPAACDRVSIARRSAHQLLGVIAHSRGK